MFSCLYLTQLVVLPPMKIEQIMSALLASPGTCDRSINWPTLCVPSVLSQQGLVEGVAILAWGGGGGCPERPEAQAWANFRQLVA